MIYYRLPTAIAPDLFRNGIVIAEHSGAAVLNSTRSQGIRITSCRLPHLRFLDGVTALANRRSPDVLELHRAISRERNHQLKVATERADVFAQGRQLHVRASFEPRHVDLTAAQAPGNFFLGDLLRLPQITKGVLLGNQLGGALLDFPLAPGRKRREDFLVRHARLHFFFLVFSSSSRCYFNMYIPCKVYYCRSDAPIRSEPAET